MNTKLYIVYSSERCAIQSAIKELDRRHENAHVIGIFDKEKLKGYVDTL